METSTTAQKHSLSREAGIMLALVAILVLGGAFRFYNVNWDEGTYHIHPDERHTTMVITAIRWPGGLDDYVECRRNLEPDCVDRLHLLEGVGEYFDTSHSPLNPRNSGMVYFYGSVPLFLTKLAATLGDLYMIGQAEQQPDPAEYLRTYARPTDYNQIHLVGRVLSGLFDLFTVVLLFFLARRLFDWRVGLVAALLLALTALNIQGSHYFSVDTFLTFFVVLTMWFILDVADGKGWLSFVGLGISMGLTLACKVSVFPLALIVILAAWLRARRLIAEGNRPGRTLANATLALVLAGMLSVVVFRVAQPYAWAGPNYDSQVEAPEPYDRLLRVLEEAPEPLRSIIVPNPQWLVDIVAAGAQQTGEADLPWGRQWTERTPWLFPLENMVLWGMGLPLGIAAWAGVGYTIFKLVQGWWRRRTSGQVQRVDAHDHQEFAPATQVTAAGQTGNLSYGNPQATGLGLERWHLIILPLAWVLLIFFWQGMQFVKSIRYFLPIYPFLAMFAAYLVVSAWDWAKRASRPAARSRTPVGSDQSTGVGAESAEPAPGIALSDETGALPNWWQRWGAKVVAGAFGAFVLVGTLAWAWAFLQIYREPVTRVQATRWMYENIESGATLHYETPGGQTGQLQLPLPSTHLYGQNGHWLYTSFTPPRDVIADEVIMNNLVGAGEPRDGAFEVRITTPDADQAILTEGEIEATFSEDGGYRHVIDIPDVQLAGGQEYLFQSRVLRGAPLLSQGAAIANEHFDDPLPFSMDGKVAFGSGPYRGLDLTLYDEDTPEKLEQLLDVLDEADYISMSSGRLWQSIPRLPMRYPITTRYYELLFAEELGFEKAAEFHSYPRLFGIEFDDTWAEEQFTVYDHPKVLIYRKTDDFDRDRVRAMLTEGVEWDKIAHWLNPRDVREWKREQERSEQEKGQLPSEEQRLEQIRERTNGLMLTEEQREVQEAGGTWIFLFDRNSLFNRWPTISWLLLIGLVGLAVLPLNLLVFQRLPDRGYILARPVGVVLLAWLSWILTNLTPLHYTRGTILLALWLMALLSWGTLLLSGQRRRLRDLWRTRKRYILVTELLFLAFFVVFWLIRQGNPDLWHAWKGGEKPMDFAYLNAVIKSTEFPPYDPWFAGGYLNYYYFGQVMVGTLIKLIGIIPSIAYNLVIPTWFAMTAMGAYSVTYNLVAKGDEGTGAESPVTARPFLFALLGALFVTVLGNLGQIHLILLKLGEGVMESFQSTIPGLAGLVRTLIGSVEVIFGGKALPIGLDEWYWNASRAIPAAPYEAVITEFPFFTFLYADLHAHLIAMPLTFLSLGIALSVVRSVANRVGQGWKGILHRLPPLLLWALAIGALRTTNTWDVPPQLLVALGALAIGEFARRGRLNWRWAVTVAWQFGLVFLLSWWVLYWPFWANYASIYNSVAVWSGSRTQIWAYLVVHGLFLFLIVSYLLARSFGRVSASLPRGGGGQHPDPWIRRLVLSIRYRKAPERLRRAGRIAGVRSLPVPALVWVALAILILVELFLLMPGLVSFTRAREDWVEMGAYAYRGLSVYALGLPIAILGLLLLFRKKSPPVERLWTYLVLLGLAMTLGVEVIVLQNDIGRMNTVFKFYLQTWLIWGVTAAAALAWILPRVRRWRRGRGLWQAILVFLVVCAALYPPLATSAKIRDRFDASLGPGLDGWTYMTTANYYDPEGAQYDLKWDLEAIRWLTENVIGSPVILEGHAPEYRWGGRYSINTGLPTVLGWNWHQRQQRGSIGDREVWDRSRDIATIYNTTLAEEAESLLRQYNVRYIVVGPLEQTYYQQTGLDKFGQMAAEGTLDVVFRNDGVTIYKVNP